MTQLTINVENPSILPHLKKILNALEGVSIARPKKKQRSGIEESFEDVRKGRITHYDSAEEFFKAFGI